MILECESLLPQVACTRAAIDTAEEYDDMDTVDLFSEVSRGMDKWLWFLEAHVQP